MKMKMLLFAEYAFLRSVPHTKAMCTCIQAFEKRDLQLLSQIDNVLVRTVSHEKKRFPYFTDSFSMPKPLI